MGKYFEVSFKISRMRKAWGWMGVYFEREHPLICVGFDNRDGWGRSVFKVLYERIDDLKDGIYFTEPYYDDETDAVWFDFSQSEKFNTLNSSKEQITLLKSFLAEVFDTIYALKQSSK